jgi:GNAT superfamily N-acetyltransferase
VKTRSRRTPLVFSIAEQSDAPAIAALLNAAADHLTELHGRGHWSGQATERGVLLAITPPVAGKRRTVTSRVIIARNRSGKIIGTLHLATKKPWAIDVSYFSPVKRALYLTGMAIEPRVQRSGIGRRMLEEAANVAREWPDDTVQAIRLDAYDTSQVSGAKDGGAGAGGFYERCGWREVGRVKYKGNPLVYFEMLL